MASDQEGFDVRKKFHFIKGQGSYKARVIAVFGVVGALHVVGISLLVSGLVAGNPALLGLALLAYGRGLLHAFDFDHISMIDNSLRKFVAEGRRPVAVGLAFSAGHSSIVLVTGVLVITGSSAIRAVVTGDSTTGEILGMIGLSVSGLYLLLVALANVGPFIRACRLRLMTRRDSGLELSPADLALRGPASRILAAPLRKVRHSGHIFGIGMLFSLGFDTSSQIGLMVITAAAGLAGSPPLALLSLPILFAAAMTLADSSNSLAMLGLYGSLEKNTASRRLNLNIFVTGISIISGISVALFAGASILDSVLDGSQPFVAQVASIDTSFAGILLAAILLIIAIGVLSRGRSLNGSKELRVSGGAPK